MHHISPYWEIQFLRIALSTGWHSFVEIFICIFAKMWCEWNFTEFCSSNVWRYVSIAWSDGFTPKKWQVIFETITDPCETKLTVKRCSLGRHIFISVIDWVRIVIMLNPQLKRKMKKKTDRAKNMAVVSCYCYNMFEKPLDLSKDVLSVCGLGGVNTYK